MPSAISLLRKRTRCLPRILDANGRDIFNPSRELVLIVFIFMGKSMVGGVLTGFSQDGPVLVLSGFLFLDYNEKSFDKRRADEILKLVSAEANNRRDPEPSSG